MWLVKKRITSAVTGMVALCIILESPGHLLWAQVQSDVLAPETSFHNKSKSASPALEKLKKLTQENSKARIWDETGAKNMSIAKAIKTILELPPDPDGNPGLFDLVFEDDRWILRPELTALAKPPEKIIFDQNWVVGSGSGLRKKKEISAKAIAQKIKTELGNPMILPLGTKKMIGEGKNAFEIVLGKSGTRNAWGWKREDHAKAMLHWIGQEWLETEETIIFDENWVVGSGPGLRKRKVVGAGDLAKKIIAKLGDPTTLPLGTKKMIGEGKNAFEIVVGKSGTRNAWGWKREDHAKAMLHWTGQEWLETEETIIFDENWVAGSRRGLRKGKVVGAGALAEKIIAELGDPMILPLGTKKMIGEGKNTFEVVVGKSGPSNAWGWKRENHAKAMLHWTGQEWLETEETIIFDENWVVGSRPGLRKEKVVGGQALAKKIIAELGNPTTLLLGTKKMIGEGKNTFEVIVGKSGYHNVWGWRREDHAKAIKYWRMQIAEDAEEILDRLDLSSVIALLGKDPLRLSQYIRLYHPDLSQEDVGRITSEAIQGLQGSTVSEDTHADYTINLAVPVLETAIHESAASSFELKGRVQPGIPFVQVKGAYTRKIRVKADGTFSAHIPLPEIGQLNGFEIYAFDAEKKVKSPSVLVNINQTGQPEDTEAAFRRLLLLRSEVLDSIQKDPARYRFLLRSLELSLLKHFTYDEQAGMRYVENLLAQEKSPVQQKLLQSVLDKFKSIAPKQYVLKSDEKPYFFQKYTDHEIRKLIKKGATGVIVANEQGTGKTLITLIVINGGEATIITPNPVVTTWAEQEAKFMPIASIEIIEGPYREREKAIEQTTRHQILTNVEFTQGMTDKRKRLLSQPNGTLVVDEADYLGSRSSQQARGTAQIEAGFYLLLTATPFKRVSQIGHVIGMLRKDDPRFQSARAFARAFPLSEESARNALFLLLNEHTLRIRKQDVFKEYDRTIPLDQQSDKLPAKVEIAPEQEGRFELSTEQTASLYELFTDYQTWCFKHRGNASVEDREFYRYSEGYFSKKHAMRQIMNDPAYIGRPDMESPKHLAMDKIVQKELAKDPKRKIVIFCEYTAQVEEYLKRYAHHGAVGYYGGLPQNKDGYLIDDKGRVRYFQVDEYENPMLDAYGDPIPSDKQHGRPMRALDYSRIRFQNNPDVQILVTNQKSGSVGVTFTASDAVIFDDLPPTFRDYYQAADRAHRIDNDRKKYDVTYYTLQANYPKTFLDSLPKDTREQYFGMGTFDEVHYRNLQRQKRIFHRIMDGVGDMNELAQIHQRFLKDQMPFLFATGEKDEAEEEFEEEEEDETELPEEPYSERAESLMGASL